MTFISRMLNEGSNPEEDEAQKTDISEDEPLVPQSALWVEKYSPRLFTELLSDDVSETVFDNIIKQNVAITSAVSYM